MTVLRSFVAAHKSLVATATSGLVIAAIVATIAIVSTGYTAQKMNLDDGSVWVANGTDQVVGRANTEVFELNTVVKGGANDLTMVQNSSAVLMVDTANATLRTIDPATSQVLDEVALPPDQAQVHLAGDRAVIFAAGTGELWIVPLVELSGFDATSPETLSLGLGAVVSVTPEGVLYAYSPERGEVSRVDAARTTDVDTTWALDVPAGGGALQITSVGTRWAVLDTGTSTVYLEGRTVDLAELAADDSPILQLAGAASERLLVGTDTSLLSVPFSGAAPVPLVTGESGSGTAPLVLDGCEFGAWSSGTAWRRCLADGDAGVQLPLDQMAGSARLVFSTNEERAVLNDTRSGATWAVQQGGELIDNWADLIVADEDQQQEENDQDLPPDIDEEQKPPVAIDDEFGARPGRATVLPVLLNDYDPNADVLVISEVDTLDESIGRLDLVTRNQQLQLTLTDTVTGPITFRYSISDGRGGVASATVTVTVRQPSENSPPQQVRTTKTTVQEGGRISTQVIGDWVDPDGDAFYLVGASVPGTDKVGYKPDGVVVFTDDPESGGAQASVTLTMSDGRDEGAGSLAITIKPAGEVPIVVEPWVAIATAGQEVTIRPMSHVRGGNGILRLNAVPAKAGSTIEPSFEAGTFTFESDDVRTHYVEFTVTDGDQTATGVVRIDVSAPPDANTRPITVPKTVFVTTLSTQTVDPTTTDIDPAGGVLVVTGVSNVAVDGPVQAEVLDQRQVRVTLRGPLDGSTVTFNYSISNGLAEATGTITVVELPIPDQFQPPLAADDEATVRVGDVIDVPVLDNDEQPDGEAITLEPELAQPLPDGAGLLFVAGDRLRYLAPETAGNYTAVYTIAGPDGQLANARVSLSVREVDVATNNPPVPARLTARVLAGETVTIEVPLSGIDADGDSVQLIGIASNPDKGSVTAVGSTSIEYVAGEYSSGTDLFRYSVTDALGARAEGTIRVGISPKLDGGRNPVANADEVTVRPNRTVSVQVLANDSDPDGSPLRVTNAEANVEGTAATVVDETTIDITPPAEPGNYSVLYTIANESGGTSTNFVNVKVDPDAPLAYPQVADTVLAVSDVLDLDTVDVAVLDNVFFADGDNSALGVSLVAGYSSSVQVLPNKRIRVSIGEKSQIIPFSVSHPDDDSIRSYAFIWVPGFDDALPQLDRTAPALKVNSEDTLTIDLNDYVVALGGNQVRLADTTSVRATHGNGDDLVVDEDTLAFTSADQYFGPASITFEVTDGTSADDPNGKTAILTLPIDVQARDNQPPVFVGGEVLFEPGQEKELDLVRLTNYPYDDVNELVYSVLPPEPAGFTYVLNGQRLVLRAATTAEIGTTTSVSLGVRDAVNDGRAGKITLQVVPSTRPLVKPVADRAITQRGQTTTIDVLTNDESNNPFPETPLQVLDIRGLSGGALPDGVSITPSADKSRLTVTVAAGVAPTDVNLQYQVADATNDPSRYVWGNVTISIQDVPDAVSAVHVSEFGDRLLKLSWTPGQFNNSPITGYQVTMTSADTGSAIGVTTCTTTVNCALTTPGNGPANAVRLSVVAINAIGPSAPASLAGSIWSDIIPPPPTQLSSRPLDQGLRVSWSKPDGGSGSPIEQYVITVGGVTEVMGVSPSDPVGTVYARNVQAPSIANGSSVVYSVSARNSAPNSLATWNSASSTGVPAGPPVVLAAPTASGSLTDGTTASIAWGGAFGDNGAAMLRYYVAIYTGSAPSCTVTGVESGSPTVDPPPQSGSVQHLSGGTTGTTFTGLTPNQTYNLTVFAYNGQGCTDSPQTQVTPRAAPGTVGSISASGPISSSPGTWDFRLDSFSIASGSTDADTFVYRLIGGSTDQSQSGVAGPGTTLTTGNGSHYGNNVGVQLKACKSYPEATLCSVNWSATFPLGVPVNNSVPTGLDAVQNADGGGVLNATGYWSWAALPQGPGYSSVSFSCGNADDPATPNQCEVDGGLLGLSFPDLTVTIAANGTTYTRQYAWNQF